eukprot:m.1082653 g.1082653  ORF g.1082653 m.1082653 type:complete len:154 (-) comp24267_c0_seq12:1490-1951(-)
MPGYRVCAAHFVVRCKVISAIHLNVCTTFTVRYSCANDCPRRNRRTSTAISARIGATETTFTATATQPWGEEVGADDVRWLLFPHSVTTTDCGLVTSSVVPSAHDRTSPGVWVLACGVHQRSHVTLFDSCVDMQSCLSPRDNTQHGQQSGGTQ